LYTSFNKLETGSTKNISLFFEFVVASRKNYVPQRWCKTMQSLSSRWSIEWYCKL